MARDKFSTASDIRAEIEARILRADAAATIIRAALATAEKMKGKQINKRFATALGLELPGYVVSYRRDDWRADVSIWSQRHDAPINYNERITIALGSHGVLAGNSAHLHICPEWINHKNPWIPRTLETGDVLRQALAQGKPEQWANQIAELRDLRSAITRDAQPFQCEYLLDI